MDWCRNPTDSHHAAVRRYLDSHTLYMASEVPDVLFQSSITPHVLCLASASSARHWLVQWRHQTATKSISQQISVRQPGINRFPPFRFLIQLTLHCYGSHLTLYNLHLARHTLRYARPCGWWSLVVCPRTLSKHEEGWPSWIFPRLPWWLAQLIQHLWCPSPISTWLLNVYRDRKA